MENGRRDPWLFAGLGAVGAGLALRRFGRRSGATYREARSPLPGDELVAKPLWESTRATTIGAPAAEVWPWIVQMGFPGARAGWYTPDWLDRLQWGIEERSTDRIVPELQALAVGDRVPDSRDGSVYFTVVAVEPERALVLVSTRHLLRPMRSVHFTWAFVLEPVGEHRTRLFIRARAVFAPRWSWLLLWPLISLGDYANATAMLHGIRARSEPRRRGFPGRSRPDPRRWVRPPGSARPRLVR